MGGWIKLSLIVVGFIVFKFFLSAVLSGSMEHNAPDDYTSWWDKHEDFYNNKNISLQQFQEFPFQNGIKTGDVVFMTLHKNPEIGDVISFKSGNRRILHRVVSIDPLETKGDNNDGQSPIDLNINKNDVIGKAWGRVSYVGYIKIGVNKIFGYFFKQST